MTVLIELNDDRSETVHYDNPDFPIYIRRGTLSHYPNYTAPSHWHDDIELVAILEGEMDYNVNGEILKLQKGEGIFVNAQQMHFGFSEFKKERNFICIILHPSLLCPTPVHERKFILPVIRNSNASFVLLDPSINWQQAILEKIYWMDQSKNSETAPLKVQSAFAEIWSLLCEHLPQDNHTVNLNRDDLTAVKNMVGFIQKNYAGRVSLKEIALAGAVGQSKCCKLFARYFGQTPNTYLNQYRLNKSLELLQNDELSITEIALTVGFGGASYYSEIFRKYFGKSPSEFKKVSLALSRRESK